MRLKRVVFCIGFLLLLLVGGVILRGFLCNVDRRLNRNTGRLLVDQAILMRHWQQLESEQGFCECVESVFADPSRQGYASRFITAEGTGNTDPPRDEFEQAFLKELSRVQPNGSRAASRPEFADRVLDRNVYQYYQAVRAQKSCMFMCHSPIARGPESDPTVSGIGATAGAWGSVKAT